MEDHPAQEPLETPLTREDVERQFTLLSEQLQRQLELSAQEAAARKDALDGREEEVRRREMAALAKEMLEERSLPAALAGALSFENEDALKEGVDALESAFRAAVQQGVEERLLSAAPKTAPLVPLSELSDEEYYAAVCRREE